MACRHGKRSKRRFVAWLVCYFRCTAAVLTRFGHGAFQLSDTRTLQAACSNWRKAFRPIGFSQSHQYIVSSQIRFGASPEKLEKGFYEPFIFNFYDKVLRLIRQINFRIVMPATSSSSIELPAELKELCNALSVSISFADPTVADSPLIFVNTEFEQLTQWPADEVLGKNCRFLQGPQIDRTVTDEIAISCRRRACETRCLVNLRRDGSAFLNLLYIQPVDVARNVTVLMGCQHAFKPTDFDEDLAKQSARIDNTLNSLQGFSGFGTEVLDNQDIVRIDTVLMRYASVFTRIKNSLIQSKVSHMNERIRQSNCPGNKPAAQTGDAQPRT